MKFGVVYHQWANTAMKFSFRNKSSNLLRTIKKSTIFRPEGTQSLVDAIAGSITHSLTDSLTQSGRYVLGDAIASRKFGKV